MTPGSPAAGGTRGDSYELLAAGRDADVFVLDERRVLRRYRDGGDVTAEVAVMRHVHAHGLPVPAAFEAAGPDLVLERLHGPTMLHLLMAGQTTPEHAAGVLADLHLRLHALPAWSWPDPAARILHMDLHPDNVVVTGAGPVLIDWRNAREGPPELDVAMTAMILAEVAVGSFVAPEVRPGARELLDRFLLRAGDGVQGQLEQALAIRKANPTLDPEEKARLDSAAALVRG